MDRHSGKKAIVRLSGGVGNQLFQYALGRALSLRHGQELVLDVSSYDNQNPREAQRRFSLSPFNIAGRLAIPSDFKEIGLPAASDNRLFARLQRKAVRILESRLSLSERKIVIEPTFYFVPEILDIRGDVFLAGVWQSPRYFNDFSEQIRRDITLKNDLSEKGRSLSELMQSTESVSIHIRRGDQVSDPHLAQKQGLLTEQYYSAARDHFNNKSRKHRFFIFSDEIDWVKANLDFGEDAVYVSEYGLTDYEELILMARCKHNVVAKSSYSWWGAWLNRNADKTVIVPKQRFGTLQLDDRDLTPEGWLRM